MADETLKDQEAPDATTASAGSDDAGDGGGGDTGAEKDAIAAVRREQSALQDRLLRTVAEFDNYRKRIERERRDLAEFAAADAMKDLLPIIDNFDRALQAPAAGDSDAFRKGIELIHKQLNDLLRKRGVRAIEAVGTLFDPNFHEAVIHEDSATHRDGEVIQELQRGYMLGDRLLRPATVKVAKQS